MAVCALRTFILRKFSAIIIIDMGGNVEEK
jgi:hypothetical protein